MIIKYNIGLNKSIIKKRKCMEWSCGIFMNSGVTDKYEKGRLLKGKLCSNRDY